ncbi:hypothetical protein ASPCAL13596 [Aspergillus calidoustus]|uniref:C2H2-type domain-containing protein n=1 Tax=Aspergillus calidoustus TaxID=454130 RepID=A0A0U5GH48_ASPCI|nr:hypothetical protein ASPCAL13596 [Aspergillus calidoustus]
MAPPQEACQEVQARRPAKDDAKTSTRRFYCPECGATFARSSHMRRHQRTNRADKPFTCRYCPLASSRKDAIIRHTRSFHPGQPLESSSNENEQIDVVDIEIGASHQSPSGDCIIPEDFVRMGGPVASHSPIMETQSSIQVPLSPSHTNLGSIALSSWLQSNGGIAGLTPTSHEDPLLPGRDTLGSPQVDFGRAFDPQFFDFDILAPLDQLEISEACFKRKAQTSLGITYEAHLQAKANLSRINGPENPSNIHFPSRPAMVRFVKAYFTHMAPYVPVVHRPTFDVSSLPPVLLLEIMACGAVYSNETEVAMAMHNNVLKLLLKSEFTSACDDAGIELKLSRLQTMLLATYFGLLSCDSYLEERARFTFHSAIELVEAVIEKPAAPTMEPRRAWIYQETMSRCVSCSIIIASGYFSTSMKRSLNIPYLDSKYPLPCPTSQWLRGEASGDTSEPAIYNSEVMEGIMQGNRPPSGLSEYAFLAILDFETGVNYLCITAPLQFDPLEIHAFCESALLLFWYLMSKKINPKKFEWHQDISDTVEEVLSEGQGFRSWGSSGDPAPGSLCHDTGFLLGSVASSTCCLSRSTKAHCARPCYLSITSGSECMSQSVNGLKDTEQPKH